MSSIFTPEQFRGPNLGATIRVLVEERTTLDGEGEVVVKTGPASEREQKAWQDLRDIIYSADNLIHRITTDEK